MFDNQDIAIFSRVNELAERHGLKPYDFIATITHEDDEKSISYVLDFGLPDFDNPLLKERFHKMLNDLEVPADNGAMLGKISTIIDALDKALQIAPRPRLGL